MQHGSDPHCKWTDGWLHRLRHGHGNADRLPSRCRLGPVSLAAADGELFQGAPRRRFRISGLWRQRNGPRRHDPRRLCHDHPRGDDRARYTGSACLRAVARRRCRHRDAPRLAEAHQVPNPRRHLRRPSRRARHLRARRGRKRGPARDGREPCRRSTRPTGRPSRARGSHRDDGPHRPRSLPHRRAGCVASGATRPRPGDPSPDVGPVRRGRPHHPAGVVDRARETHPRRSM